MRSNFRFGKLNFGKPEQKIEIKIRGGQKPIPYVKIDRTGPVFGSETELEKKVLRKPLNWNETVFIRFGTGFVS